MLADAAGGTAGGLAHHAYAGAAARAGLPPEPARPAQPPGLHAALHAVPQRVAAPGADGAGRHLRVRGGGSPMPAPSQQPPPSPPPLPPAAATEAAAARRARTSGVHLHVVPKFAQLGEAVEVMELARMSGA